MLREIKVAGSWVTVSPKIFRSWSGERRLDGVKFNGPAAITINESFSKPEYRFRIRVNEVDGGYDLEIYDGAVDYQFESLRYGDDQILDLLTELECWDDGTYDRPRPAFDPGVGAPCGGAR